MNSPLIHRVTFVAILYFCGVPVKSAVNVSANPEILSTKGKDRLHLSLPPAEYFDNSDDSILYDYDYYGDREEIETEKSPSKLDKILPLVEFECSREGYFADSKFDCEAFHYCSADGTRFTFLCGDGSKFNQRTLICDFDHALQCGQIQLDSSKPISFDNGINSFSFDKQEVTSESSTSNMENTDLPIMLLNRSNSPVIYRNDEPKISIYKPEINKLVETAHDTHVTPISYEHVLEDVHQLVSEMKRSKSSSSAQETYSTNEIDNHKPREEIVFDNINQEKINLLNIPKNSAIFSDSGLRARSGRNIALEDQGLLAIRNMVQSSPWSDNYHLQRDNPPGNEQLYENRKHLPFYSQKQQYDHADNYFDDVPSGDTTFHYDESPIRKDKNDFGFFERLPQKFDFNRKFTAQKNGHFEDEPKIFSSSRYSNNLPDWRGIIDDKPLRHNNHPKHKDQVAQLAEASNNKLNLIRRNPNRRQTPSHQVSIDQLRQFQHELSVQRPPHFPILPPPPSSGPPLPPPSVPPPPPHNLPPPHQLETGFHGHHNGRPIIEKQPFIEDHIRHNFPSNSKPTSTFQENPPVRHSPPEVRNYHLGSIDHNQFKADPQEFFVTQDNIHRGVTPTLRPFHAPSIPPIPQFSPVPQQLFSTSSKEQHDFRVIAIAPKGPVPSEPISETHLGIEENPHFPPNVIHSGKEAIVSHDHDGAHNSGGLVATKNELGYDTFVAPQFVKNFNNFPTEQHHGNQPLSPHFFHKIPLPSLQPPHSAGISPSPEFHEPENAFESNRENFKLAPVSVAADGRHIFESTDLQHQDLVRPSHSFINPSDELHKAEQEFHADVQKQPLSQDDSFSNEDHLVQNHQPFASFTHSEKNEPNPLFHHDSIFPTEAPIQFGSHEFTLHSQEPDLKHHEGGRIPDINTNAENHLEVFSKSRAPPPKITTPLPKIVVHETTTREEVPNTSVLKEKEKNEVTKAETEPIVTPVKTNKRRRNRFRYRTRSKTSTTQSSNETKTERQPISTSHNIQLKRLRSRRPSRRRRPSASVLPSHGATNTDNHDAKTAPDAQASSQLGSTKARGRPASLRLPAPDEVKVGLHKDFGSLRLRHRQKSSNHQVNHSNQSSKSESSNQQSFTDISQNKTTTDSEQVKSISSTRNAAVPVLDRDFRRFGRRRHRIRLRNFIQNATDSILQVEKNTEANGTSENISESKAANSSVSSIGHWRRLRGKRRRFRTGNSTLRSSARHSQFPLIHKLSSVLPNNRVIKESKSKDDIAKLPVDSVSDIKSDKLEKDEQQHEENGGENKELIEVLMRDEEFKARNTTSQNNTIKGEGSDGNNKFGESDDQKTAANNVIFKSESPHSHTEISLNGDEQTSGGVLSGEDISSHNNIQDAILNNYHEEIKSISDNEKLHSQVDVEDQLKSTGSAAENDFPEDSDDNKQESQIPSDSRLSPYILDDVEPDSSSSIKINVYSTHRPISKPKYIDDDISQVKEQLSGASNDLFSADHSAPSGAQSRRDDEHRIEYVDAVPSAPVLNDTPLLPLQSLFAGMR